MEMETFSLSEVYKKSKTQSFMSFYRHIKHQHTTGLINWKCDFKNKTV